MSTPKKKKNKNDINMTNVAKLQKENDDLKKQVADFAKELNDMKDKMAALNNEPKDIQKSIQHFSDEYDDIRSNYASMSNELTKLSTRLRMLEESIQKVDEAIEDINKYSYQYNIKIVGVPRNRKETAKETVDICLKLFEKIGAEVTSFDIDIAHRVSPRDTNSIPPIICKFTRRIAKEAVMSCKRELRNIDRDEMGLQPNGRISIYDHLTPKAQALFLKAKEFQLNHGFKFCWTGRNSNILLRESDDSDIIRVKNQGVLNDLMLSRCVSPMVAPESPVGMSDTSNFRGRGRGRRQGRLTRSSYRQNFTDS